MILQVSTGLFGQCTAEEPAVVGKRLDELLRRLPACCVIYGWGKREGLFETILETAHRHGAEAWLWLPVFADVRDPEAADPMVFYGDGAEKAVNACPGEEFHFVCPGSDRNRKAVLDAYDSLTEGCVPDGVFLDRIRYPSAVFSPLHFFGCRCANCLKRQKRSGIDTERLQQRIGGEKSPAWRQPESLENGRYHYRDPDVEHLSELKRRMITETVTSLSRVFHGKGIKVGIDVFAPALADLVGQDLDSLMPQVEMMKPMMYFRTLAPAGIPYETQAYGDVISGWLAKMWGMDVCADRSMEKQLRSLPESGGRLCPGIEINRIPGICEPDGKSFGKAIRAAEAAGCEAVVLSWNVLQAREEELREIEAALKEG